VTTFENMDAALAKLRSGQLNFDVFFPTIDVMGQLAYGKMIQPLNHSYIPNIAQAWPDFTNPFYDGKWQYTVPYTIYTTGMAWRKDHVNELEHHELHRVVARHCRGVGLRRPDHR